MRKVIIEPYNNSFKTGISSLILNIQNNEFSIPITLAMQPDLEDIPGYYQAGLGNFWVAKVDGNVVGTIALLDIGQRKGALRKMFVAREYRGMPWAAGQQLLDTLLYWAKEKKFGEIYLGTTAKFLAAHRFYEKNGFAAINKETLPGGFPMMEVDVKFYKRSV